MNHSKSQTLFDQAKKIMPGGVNSPVRAYKSVGGKPIFIKSGQGPNLIDEDGNSFIDLVSGYGAIIHGHSDATINQAVKAKLDEGTTFGVTTEVEIDLATEIISRVDGCEMVRMVNSGTEAVMSAVRLAKGVTGRSKVVKFSGCYHGHLDSLMASAGSGVATNNLSDSAGVSESQIKDTVIADYNSFVSLDSDVGCVIVEPIAANMNLVLPQQGFLKHLRQECDRVGAILIFDEVITGFRVGFGGASGVFGVTPDLWCFGKIIGGGMPVGCYGGKKEIMEKVSPSGPVYQAGTLSGNGASMAAGLAALQKLTQSSYEELNDKVQYFSGRMNELFISKGIDIFLNSFNTLSGLYCGVSKDELSNFTDVKANLDTELYQKLFWYFADSGVLMAPSAYEVCFIGLSHETEHIDLILDVTSKFLSQISN